MHETRDVSTRALLKKPRTNCGYTKLENTYFIFTCTTLNIFPRIFLT